MKTSSDSKDVLNISDKNKLKNMIETQLHLNKITRSSYLMKLKSPSVWRYKIDDKGGSLEHIFPDPFDTINGTKDELDKLRGFDSPNGTKIGDESVTKFDNSIITLVKKSDKFFGTDVSKKELYKWYTLQRMIKE